MANLSVGLNTLQTRISQIEKTIGEDYDCASTFVKIAVSDLKSQQYAKLVSDISLFVQNFQKNIPDNVDAYNNIVQIISYAVKYVEQYIAPFSQLVGKSVTSDFKLQTCLNLIKEVTTKFDDVFLTNTINTIVSIHFPKSTPLPPLQRKQSISKKAGMRLTSFMKKK